MYRGKPLIYDAVKIPPTWYRTRPLHCTCAVEPHYQDHPCDLNSEVVLLLNHYCSKRVFFVPEKVVLIVEVVLLQEWSYTWPIYVYCIELVHFTYLVELGQYIAYREKSL